MMHHRVLCTGTTNIVIAGTVLWLDLLRERRFTWLKRFCSVKNKRVNLGRSAEENDAHFHSCVSNSTGKTQKTGPKNYQTCN